MDAAPRALVRSELGWRAIERMVDVLMERGVLEYEEAKAILADAYGAPMPRFGAWADHWLPSLDAIRAGWLPAAKAPSFG